jgi:hypothetical protein
MRAYGQLARTRHSRTAVHSGMQAMRLKMIPKAPRRMLADFASGK